jgi:hypothetical protein
MLSIIEQNSAGVIFVAEAVSMVFYMVSAKVWFEAEMVGGVLVENGSLRLRNCLEASLLLLGTN